MSTSHISLQLREQLSRMSCKLAALKLFFHLDEALTDEEISGIDYLFESVLTELEHLDTQLSQ